MSLKCAGRVLAAVAAVVLAPPVSARQAGEIPRTPDGRPDLQGVWTNATITPLERPAALADREFLTEEEAAELERASRERNDADIRSEDPREDLSTGYNDFWWDRGTEVVSTLRTSIIVDPPDGRVPAQTPLARERAAARRASRNSPPEGPEDLSLADRCIYRSNNGPPMLPGPYNNNYQIFQTPGHVVILIEMIHDARIVPIVDEVPAESGHLPPDVRQWFGDPIGYWEGETLVVETTNFSDQTSFRGSGPNLRVVERFTRVDSDTLLYEFTVDDPESFTRPWSGEIPMQRVEGLVYEYACHEGNYAVPNILSAAQAVPAN